jgi:hypothetical protein
MQEETTTRRRAPLLALSVAGVFVLLLVVLVGGSSPTVCATCHGEAVEAQRASVHATSGCYDCHAATVSEVVAFKSFEVFRMYPYALIGREPSGPVRETARHACLECHGSVLQATLPGASGIKIAHDPCAPGVSCDSCHASVAHGEVVRWPRQPVMQDCTACHVESNTSVDCETCHEGRLQSERIDEGPWQVTHGPNWQQTHGMGELDSCETCHPDDYCVDCHGVEIPHRATFGSRHGEEAIAMSDSCETCHTSTAFCDACHGIDMPHAEDYIVIHAEDAGGLKENPTCMRCHALEDCESCHLRHIHPGGVKDGLVLPQLGGDS